jgi:hypothetical protein
MSASNDFAKRMSILHGDEPLVANGNGKGIPETLTAHYRRASREEKLATATDIGVNVVFDEMLAPLLK